MGKYATINIFMSTGASVRAHTWTQLRTSNEEQNAMAQSPTLVNNRDTPTTTTTTMTSTHWKFRIIDTINLNAKYKFLHFFRQCFFAGRSFWLVSKTRAAAYLTWQIIANVYFWIGSFDLSLSFSCDSRARETQTPAQFAFCHTMPFTRDIYSIVAVDFAEC